jgi:hypothetical protein
MRKFQIFSLAIFAVLAFASLATSAFAVENAQLLVGGASIALGAETHIEVLAENAEGKATKLELEDMGVGTAVTCTPEGLGFALANGAGTQETGTCSGITVTKGTCGSPEVVAQNLPWTLQVEQEGAAFSSTIKSAVTAGAGWLVECTVLGVKVDDVCTTQKGLVSLVGEVTGLVLVTFAPTKAEEFANCTVGGKEEGLVNGTFELHALGSGTEELETLSVSLATEVS